MEKNRIKELITLSQTRFLNFYHAIYENKYGQQKDWFIASRKTEEVMRKQCLEGKDDVVDAVLILAIHEEDEKLVLIRQYRVPLNDYVYELPAGLIDTGEDYKVSVARELKEETGLELVEVDEKRSIAKTYLSAGMTDESVALVYCKCKGKLSTDYMEADEDIEPMLISKEEAKKILASNHKIDIKAYMALQNYCNEV
ncbi:MAG: NUDIX hydrolase [Cellulosilyticum sp.]|nr:NUDIX hydrolase [Cellulosilyticum sp.]